MKKKTLLPLVVLLLLASVTLPSGTAPQPPVNPNVLSIGTIGMPSKADPSTAYDTASCELIRNVYEPLIDFDRDLTRGPCTPFPPGAAWPDPRKQGLIDQFVPRLAVSLPTKEVIILDLTNMTVVNQSNPKSTIWEDGSGKWYHINGWRDNNPDGELGSCDVIYMEQINASAPPFEWIPCTKFTWHVELKEHIGSTVHLVVKRTWYVFELRTGVMIHPWKDYTGTQAPAATLTCADVEYSFERAMVQDRLNGPTWMLYKPMLDAMNADDGWNTSDIADLTDLARLIDCAIQQDGAYIKINVGIDFPEIAWYQILSQTWSCVVPKDFAIDHGCWNGTWFNVTDPSKPIWQYWRRWPTPTGSPLDYASATYSPVPGVVAPSWWTGWANHAEPAPILRGTGPYTFTYLDKTKKMWRVDKFNNYWTGWVRGKDPHRYLVSTVIVKENPDWTTRKLAFLAGDNDTIAVPRAYMYDLQEEVPPGSGNWVPLPGIICYKDIPLLQSDSLHFICGGMQIAISDPGIDAFEAGLTRGRSPIPHSHVPPEPPYITHNDASLVSHDIYGVTRVSPTLPPCPGGNWALVGYTGVPSGCLAVIESAIITSPLEVSLPPLPPTNQTYWKPGFPDYAPSGMPDFDQRQWGTYNWTDLRGNWSHCGPTAIANSLWWLDSEFETNTAPPPEITDNFSLVTSYSASWDDHDPQNVQPFIEHLAYLMDTDGQRTRMGHFGTEVTDLQTGLAQYLSWAGVNPQGDCNGDGIVDIKDQWIVGNATGSRPGMPNWNMAADIWPVTTGWPNRLPADNNITSADLALVTANMGNNGTFYERTIATPDPDLIKREVGRCEDVVLTLGFWRFDSDTGEWYREDGHFVTVAGYVPQPEFFGNEHARKAFAYALNFTALIRDAWFGEAVQPATPLIDGLSPDYRDPFITKYDLDYDNLVAELHAAIYNVTGTPESLWDSGFTLTINYNLGNDQRKIACEIVEYSLEHIPASYGAHGPIVINVVGLPWDTYLDQMESGNLQIFFAGWQADFSDADNWVRTYMHSDGYFANIQGYSNARVDELIDLAVKTADVDPTVTKTIENMTLVDLTSPICTYWHEIAPTPSLIWHICNWIDGWKGAKDGKLSSSDCIKLNCSEWWHVKTMSYNAGTKTYTLELERSRRTDMYEELQWIFIEDCPSLMIVQPLGRAWMRDWVQGWYYNPLFAACKSLCADAQNCPFYDLWKGFLEDFNRDMKVNILDLVKIAGKFGQPAPPCSPNDIYDLDFNCKVNILDLVKCAIAFGKGVP